MDLKDVMAINLRRLRHGEKVTQEELADRAGLSARYVSSLERGAAAATVTVLGRLADALGVSACELIQAPSRRRRPGQRTSN